jgi:hypothetical protein
VLQLLVVNRLIDPGNEFRVHRQWFDQNGMDALLGVDFAVAEKDRLYRCLDRILKHKQDLFIHLQQRWKSQIEQIVIQTLESTPRGRTHWSTRELARASGLSRMTISCIWRAFGLQPHRSETFKLSPDPLLVEKVRDIVGLYMNPPDHALVVCLD